MNEDDFPHPPWADYLYSNRRQGEQRPGFARPVRPPGQTTRLSFSDAILHFTADQTKDNDMSFTNPQAAEIAREILDEQTKGDLRERVTAAVAHLTELVKDTNDGSGLTFVKVADNGKRFHYVTVKSGGHGYTSAERPRILHNDGQLIEWLIGLEIYEDNQMELRPGAPVNAAIEATATES